MGTWDIGPFDNDAAADWCGDLEDADPAQRPAMVERALAVVLEPDAGEYLDSGLAVEAVAAAAIVAGQLPGGPTIDSPYAPDFITEGGVLPLPGHLPGLALRALDRITGDRSELRELWEDGFAEVVAELAPIRAALKTVP